MTDTTDKLIIQSETRGVQQTTNEVQGLSKAMDGVSVASQNVERSTTSVEGKFASLERRLGTTAGQASQLEKIQKTINTAVAQNPALQERANALLAAAEQRYAAVGKTAGLARYELINLSRQAQDVAVSLGSGQSFGTVLLQQGSQISDVFASSQGTVKGFFGQVAEGAARILTPMRLAVGGIAGVGAAALYLGNSWQEAAAEVDRALTGIGAKSGTTAQDITNFTRANASAAGLSTAAARNAALEFTKTGEVAIAGLKGVGDAIRGYSLLTGKDATEATKAFAGALSGDLVKGILELDQRYGALDARTISYIKTLADAGDKTKALQVFIDATADANKRAEASVGGLEKAWQFTKNLFSNIASGGNGPGGLEEQIKDVEATIRALEGTGFDAFAARLKSQLKDLNEELAKTNAKNAADQLTILSGSATRLSDAIFPQIEAIRKLNDAIRTIEKAKIEGVAPDNADAALTVYRQQIQLQQESLDMTVRQTQVTQQLQMAWGLVTTQTALQLQQLQGQLSVAQQVTAAGQMKAQYEATYNTLLAQGLSSLEAQLIASKQLEVSQAAATANVERQTQALKDQNAMIKARENGTEATTAASIAYRNAIDSGADSTAAAALKAQTLKNYMLQASSAASSFASNIAGAASGLDSLGRPIRMETLPGDYNSGNAYTSSFDVPQGQRLGNALTPQGLEAVQAQQFYQQWAQKFANGGQSILNQALQSGGGIDAAISKLMGLKTTPGATYQNYGETLTEPYADFGSLFQNIDSLYQLKNAFTTDKSQQVANLQQEMAWLQAQPQSLAQMQAIVNLQKSIDQLKNSTDDLNGTNQALLSPYYNQDPRTSHIGFRSQGMAAGGYVDVPGMPSANDNMIATIPVASGERIYVDPMPSVRGGAGGQVINVSISAPVTINGNANKDEVGRTLYQNNQNMANQIVAALRR